MAATVLQEPASLAWQRISLHAPKIASRETCATGICETCADGKQNQTETDVDCGGICAPGALCADGLGCEDNSDCQSKVCDCPDPCENKVCQEATCDDGVMNGTETDIDLRRYVLVRRIHPSFVQ